MGGEEYHRKILSWSQDSGSADPVQAWPGGWQDVKNWGTTNLVSQFKGRGLLLLFPNDQNYPNQRNTHTHTHISSALTSRFCVFSLQLWGPGLYTAFNLWCFTWDVTVQSTGIPVLLLFSSRCPDVSNFSAQEDIYDPVRMTFGEAARAPVGTLKGGHRRSKTLLEGEERKFLPLLLSIWWIFTALSSSEKIQRHRWADFLLSKRLKPLENNVKVIFCLSVPSGERT